MPGKHPTDSQPLLLNIWITYFQSRFSSALHMDIYTCDYIKHIFLWYEPILIRLNQNLPLISTHWYVYSIKSNMRLRWHHSSHNTFIHWCLLGFYIFNTSSHVSKLLQPCPMLQQVRGPLVLWDSELSLGQMEPEKNEHWVVKFPQRPWTSSRAKQWKSALAC